MEIIKLGHIGEANYSVDRMVVVLVHTMKIEVEQRVVFSCIDRNTKRDRRQEIRRHRLNHL